MASIRKEREREREREGGGRRKKRKSKENGCVSRFSVETLQVFRGEGVGGGGGGGDILQKKTHRCV